MANPELTDQLAEIAKKNLGFVTAAQANAAGISQAELDEAVEWGVLATQARQFDVFARVQKPLPYPTGIYRHAEQLSVYDKNEWLVVTLIRADPSTVLAERSIPSSGVISHKTAAQFHNLETKSSFTFTFPPGCVDSIEQAQRDLDIVTGGTRIANVMVYIKPISFDECEYIDGIPVTTLPRTLNDLILDTTLDINEIGYLLTLVLARKMMGEKELSQTVMRAGAEKFLIPKDEEVLTTLLESYRRSREF